MQCKFCESDMWDNRETKRQDNYPDYKCKNKSCGAASWLNEDGSVYWKKGTPKPESTPKPVLKEAKEKVDWDGKELRIVRQSMVKAAVEYAKTNPDVKLKDVKLIAEEFVDFVYKGLKE